MTTDTTISDLSQSFHAARTLIDGANRIVLTTHVQPDGDGIGSEVALALYLRAIGKTVTILNPHATPARFRFLEPDPPIVAFEPRAAEEILFDAELIIVLDISVRDRLGKLQPFVAECGAKLLVIDHHVGPSDFDGPDCRDVGAAATGEIVYSMLKEWAADITPEIAAALYTAILYDTGGFRFSNTTASTHEIAAGLIRCGVDAPAINRRVFESTSVGKTKLLARVYGNFRLSPGGSVASSVVSLETMAELGAEAEDVEGIVESLREVVGVEVALLFKEVNESTTKVSFRSAGDVDVREFAEKFGGGGHRNASGALIHEPLGAVVDRVTSLAYEDFDRPAS